MAVTVIVRRERKQVDCKTGCGSTIGYEASDLQKGTLIEGALIHHEKAYIVCPVCGVHIIISATR